MDRSQITNLLNILKTTTDKKILLKGLHKLRAEVVNNEGISAFRESLGISIMVRFLGKPKEEILEIALSILANCCTDSKCCKEAFESRVVVNLMAILKSVPNPVIQCRACRLLGNLAKVNATELLQNGNATIAKSLCQIIEETSDVGTRVMAIRATRYLIGDPQFLKFFLHSNGFIIILQLINSIMRKSNSSEMESTDQPASNIGLKKTQHREKYFEEVARSLEIVRSDIFDREVSKNSEQQPILHEMPIEKAALDVCFEIVKCLSIMSDMKLSLPVWNALHQKGCNLSTIVFLASEESKQRSIALRILANFSKNSAACFILSNSNAVTAASDLLLAADMKNPLTESETRYCLNVLGYLSVDACNRSKIRRSGAIRKLILMARNSNSQTEISSILQLLNNFHYDNMSMELMLKEGLIPVLIRELNNYLSSNDDYYKKKREERQERVRKRKLKDETMPASKVGRFSLDCAFDSESPSCSPKPSASPNSPCSSRSMSPLYKSGNDDDESDEDETYSPICTDEEEDSGNELDDEKNSSTDILQLLETISTHSVENSDNEADFDDASQDVYKQPKYFLNMSYNTIDIIENLFFRVTLLVNKRAELGKSDTMLTLIKAMNAFGVNSNFAGALTNILVESQFFAQTIKHGVAHQLYKLTKKEETRLEGLAFSDTLTCVGESNYGKAELVQLLRSDDVLSQKRAAIAVAYIIKNRKMLLQFLNDGNVLNLLFDVIFNSSLDDELTAEAIDALTSLAKNTLNISMPVEDDKTAELGVTEDSNKVSPDSSDNANFECDMRFLLYGEDQTEPVNVVFNKQLLCDSSEVFNKMLNSSFREGNKREIELHDYTVDGLEYFLNLIKIGDQATVKIEPPPPEKHHALLEAYEMSQIYDVPSIESMGQHMLIRLLDEKNCLRVLQWAIKNFHPELMEHAINYYLCSELPAASKTELFRTAKASSCATEWLDMLTEAILCRCQDG